MIRTKTFALISAISFLFCSAAQADIVMTVVASPAPNVFGSPNWAGYLANALNSLENSLGEIGDRTTDPTAYETFAEGELVAPSELIVSNFASWRGVADPAPPFDAENGNRVHFGVHIVGDGVMRFRLEDLSYSITSDDGNILGFSGDFSGLTYSATRIGIDYGGDQAKGGGDDTIINSGAATQIVDELIYVGVGNAYDASFATGPSNQEKMDQTIDAVTVNAWFDVTGGYVLTDDTGSTTLASASASFTVVPEPSSALVVFILAGIAFVRRRKSG